METNLDSISTTDLRGSSSVGKPHSDSGHSWLIIAPVEGKEDEETSMSGASGKEGRAAGSWAVEVFTVRGDREEEGNQ